MNNVNSIISKHRPKLERYEELYKHLHRNPELSYKEKETSSLIAKELRQYKSQHASPGYIVKENIGGFGLVGMLENGPGPIVMLRADMDALPILEKTGLEYASTVRALDREGNE